MSQILSQIVADLNNRVQEIDAEVQPLLFEKQQCESLLAAIDTTALTDAVEKISTELPARDRFERASKVATLEDRKLIILKILVEHDYQTLTARDIAALGEGYLGRAFVSSRLVEWEEEGYTDFINAYPEGETHKGRISKFYRLTDKGKLFAQKQLYKGPTEMRIKVGEGVIH